MSIGERLAKDPPALNTDNVHTYITRVSATVMSCKKTHETIKYHLKKLKSNKACGPDNVAPKLLKLARDAIIPSLTSIHKMNANKNIVPNQCKLANVSAIYKKDDETNKYNYLPISLLSVPGKPMESSVATTINAHIDKHGLSSSRQWAYKKNHSTELLLIQIIDDWKRALDNKQLVLGVVFFDFRKAFDSIDHSLLLQKLHGLDVAGDL